MGLAEVIVKGQTQYVRKRSIAHRMMATATEGLVEGKLESEGQKKGGRPRKSATPVNTKDAGNSVTEEQG